MLLVIWISCASYGGDEAPEGYPRAGVVPSGFGNYRVLKAAPTTTSGPSIENHR